MCEFLREMEESPAQDELLNTTICDDIPLNPRDAFFDGRTNVNTLYLHHITFKLRGNAFTIFESKPYVTYAALKKDLEEINHCNQNN